MSVYRDFRRVLASSVRPLGAQRLVVLVLCGALLMGGGGGLLAQGASEQQIRCLQLQQELASAQGGGAGSEDLPRIEQQIAQADRVFQGTQAAMEDAGCFESFFIFGRGLVRSPKCLKMNDRVEDARRQLTQFQQQRQAILGGGGNRRRQAELRDALARSGCGGEVAAPRRRGGGLFDFFGGGQEQEEEQAPQTPIYRSIDPNGRYRSVCVRLCDGFFYPISFATYGAHLADDASQCQSNCAAPAELYVYRNPGQEIEQAVSLNGSAYMDLPVAMRFRKEYVKGCSCKQAEYNPTEIEAANKRAEADAAAKPGKGKGKVTVKAPPPPPAPAPQAAAPAATGDQQQLNLDVTGSNEPAAPPPPQQAAPAAVPQAQQPPAPPPAAEAAPSPPPAPTAQAAAPQPPAPAATAEDASAAQSTNVKRKTAPASPAAGPFAPQ